MFIKKSFLTFSVTLFLIYSIAFGGTVYSVYADQNTDGNGETTATTTDPTVSAPTQGQTATSTDQTGNLSSDVGGNINTGDATATTTVSNDLNTNTTNPDQSGETNSSSITASSTNNGILDNTASSTATTGDNSVLGGVGSNTVTTGDAVATANVINVVNTNIFNSNGLLLFLNQLFGGGLDLSAYDLSYFFEGSPGSSPAPNATGSEPCTILTCLNSSKLNVFNTNDAQVTNTVLARASTGGNTASSTGSAGVNTGDAYAAVNVLNLVNTNLVNSSYLLVSFNNFGNLSENITLPSADFFDKFLSGGGALPQLNSSTYEANNNNFGTTTATTTAQAVTGGNSADGSATSTDISTGQAYSSASTFNQENTNLLGGASIFMLFRVWGDWTGKIQGLPSGISWSQTPNGIALVSDNSTSTNRNEGDTCKYTDNTLTGGPCFNSSSFLASSTNNANLSNDVQVYALTGDNEAKSDNGTSTIKTGNAYATANVVNLVNTNVLGRNWIFAIFNIFGNWSGNISFGKPNLWVGAVAQTQNPTPPDSDVTYEITVKNSGSADAEDVVLSAEFDKGTISFVNDHDAVTTDTSSTWKIGSIPRNESKVFHFTGRVPSIPSGTSLSVPLSITVSTSQGDANPVDNKDIVTIMVTAPLNGAPSSGGGIVWGGQNTSSYSGNYNLSADPKIIVTKTADVSTTTAPKTVNYQVTVVNDKSSGPLYNSILTDTLTDPSGAIMYSRSWDLDSIAPGDEINLTYSVAFASTTISGLYQNVASVRGFKNFPGGNIYSMNATGTVMFLGDNSFGTSTSFDVSTSTLTRGDCTTFLTTPMKQGSQNNSSDVLKLQTFLSTVQGMQLPVTGYFGGQTLDAIKSFQKIYSTDILEPAGLRSPTGVVQKLTLQKINHIMCGWPGELSIKSTSQLKTMATVSKPKNSPLAKTSAQVKTTATINSKTEVVSKQEKNMTASVIEASQVQPPKNKKWFNSLLPFLFK